MGNRDLEGLYNPKILPKAARMSAKWGAEWRPDSPSFHLCSKDHDMVSTGPQATVCLSPLEEGFGGQI